MVKQPLLLTVSQLNRYLKSKFEEDSNLTSVFLTGELSNFTHHYKSGHLYFSIKDTTATIKAVMFSTQSARLRFLPQDGMKVIARGRVSIYEATGQYQLYVEDLQSDGVGALNLAYEQLKAKLEKEGLFAAERKQPIPAYPQRIGVVTSSTGAAVQDILNILSRRYPVAEVILAPVLVQGEGAAQEIADAIERFNALDCVDLLIVGRGGGSIEDLWAFNEERVARAVAASHIPIISAVGHETDFTICDFVADLRAPTPSAAAELAVPNREDLLQLLQSYRYTITQLLERRLSQWKQQVDLLSSSPYLASPDAWIRARRESVALLTSRLRTAMKQNTAQQKTRMAVLVGKLEGLSPLKALNRGFVYAADKTGKLLTDATQVQVGDTIFLTMKNGKVRCVVDEVSREEFYESENNV